MYTNVHMWSLYERAGQEWDYQRQYETHWDARKYSRKEVPQVGRRFCSASARCEWRLAGRRDVS